MKAIIVTLFSIVFLSGISIGQTTKPIKKTKAKNENVQLKFKRVNTPIEKRKKERARFKLVAGKKKMKIDTIERKELIKPKADF